MVNKKDIIAVKEESSSENSATIKTELIEQDAQKYDENHMTLEQGEEQLSKERNEESDFFDKLFEDENHE